MWLKFPIVVGRIGLQKTFRALRLECETMVFIAWEILNDTKQYGHFGYVHAKNKEKALKRARILFWKKGYVAGVSPLW